jgi:hypothetical protein
MIDLPNNNYWATHVCDDTCSHIRPEYKAMRNVSSNTSDGTKELRERLYATLEQFGLPVGFLLEPKRWQHFHDAMDTCMKLIEEYAENEVTKNTSSEQRACRKQAKTKER